jgi:hypothetical protein
MREERLESVDLAMVDGALGEDNDVQPAHLVFGCEEHPIDEAEVQALGWDELEESEGLFQVASNRTRERSEV